MQVGAKVIAGQAARIEYVDMRYSNGFTVGWRKGHKPKKVPPRSLAYNKNGVPQFDG
jgi:hypothetical protein